MVRVAMQLMAGHMLKAATSTRKFLKASHWLLKVRKETPHGAGGAGGGSRTCKRAYVRVRHVRAHQDTSVSLHAIPSPFRLLCCRKGL